MDPKNKNNGQLVLTRRIGERIIIGNGDVVITIVDIQRNQVRIGFKADKNIKIDREEIYLRKQEGKGADKEQG